VGQSFDTYAQDATVDTVFKLAARTEAGRDTDAYIAHCIATASPTYVLANRADGTVLVHSTYASPRPHRVEFGYVLARLWWGSGS